MTLLDFRAQDPRKRKLGSTPSAMTTPCTSAGFSQGVGGRARSPLGRAKGRALRAAQARDWGAVDQRELQKIGGAHGAEDSLIAAVIANIRRSHSPAAATRLGQTEKAPGVCAPRASQMTIVPGKRLVDFIILTRASGFPRLHLMVGRALQFTIF